MRRSLTVAALVLAFSCPTFAGIMHTPVAPAPPPPTAVEEEQATDGIMPNGEPDSLTATVLSVLESVLALL